MSEYTYITLRKFCEFHEIESRWVEEIIDFGLITPLQVENQLCIEKEDLPQLETMLRLRIQLEINPAGIETIMHMREKIERLNQRLRELETRLGRT
jgi:hypothetical protein